jgi:MFS family permease
MMVARIFQGFGICAPLSLGASYIKDMYYSKDRGKALGVWTLGITAGPFIGPFISGYVDSVSYCMPGAHHDGYG